MCKSSDYSRPCIFTGKHKQIQLAQLRINYKKYFLLKTHDQGLSRLRFHSIVTVIYRLEARVSHLIIFLVRVRGIEVY